MKYPLKDVLSVKKLRQDRAQRELMKKKALVEEAAALVVQMQKKLDDYIRWRIEEERKLYRSIEKKVVKVRAVEDIRETVAFMKQKQVSHEQDLENAKAAHRKAVEAMETARHAYLMAAKETEKVEEHKKEWTVTATREEEHRLEKEMEDFRVVTQILG